MSSLAGKVALVTGGNSGIGLATAKEFHANGAKVVISGRDRGTLEEVSRELGNNVLVVPADVTKLNEIDQLMARAHETFGKCRGIRDRCGWWLALKYHVDRGPPIFPSLRGESGGKHVGTHCSPKRLCYEWKIV
jgi:NAD(P)-dependent dehydrogenase (short-subunit alcohol dehydrogenase family)